MKKTYAVLIALVLAAASARAGPWEAIEEKDAMTDVKTFGVVAKSDDERAALWILCGSSGPYMSMTLAFVPDVRNRTALGLSMTADVRVDERPAEVVTLTAHGSNLHVVELEAWTLKPITKEERKKLDHMSQEDFNKQRDARLDAAKRNGILGLARAMSEGQRMLLRVPTYGGAPTMLSFDLTGLSLPACYSEATK